MRTDTGGAGLDRLAAGHAAHGAPGLRIHGHVGSDPSLHDECVLVRCRGVSPKTCSELGGAKFKIKEEKGLTPTLQRRVNKAPSP
jgi:hypothetical protein